jgi:hypothetical protein
MDPLAKVIALLVFAWNPVMHLGSGEPMSMGMVLDTVECDISVQATQPQAPIIENFQMNFTDDASLSSSNANWTRQCDHFASNVEAFACNRSGDWYAGRNQCDNDRIESGCSAYEGHDLPQSRLMFCADIRFFNLTNEWSTFNLVDSDCVATNNAERSDGYYLDLRQTVSLIRRTHATPGSCGGGTGPTEVTLVSFDNSVITAPSTEEWCIAFWDDGATPTMEVFKDGASMGSITGGTPGTNPVTSGLDHDGPFYPMLFVGNQTDDVVNADQEHGFDNIRVAKCQ